MTCWIYRKPEPTNGKGFCVLCKTKPQRKTSSGTYQALCKKCERLRWNIKKKNYEKRKYVKFKEDACSRCEFIPEHSSQLDVHHIDGNHHNNDPNNLTTLCVNCHRLEHRQRNSPPRAGNAQGGLF